MKHMSLWAPSHGLWHSNEWICGRESAVTLGWVGRGAGGFHVLLSFFWHPLFFPVWHYWLGPISLAQLQQQYLKLLGRPLENIEKHWKTFKNIDVIIEWPEEGPSDEAPSSLLRRLLRLPRSLARCKKEGCSQHGAQASFSHGALVTQATGSQTSIA